jgi:hypothetical protein
MATGRIASTFTVGGVSFTSQLTKEAEGSIGQDPTLAAGIAGAISSAGVDGLATGHGIEGSDVIDVHWDDPDDGTRKCRRGLTVDTANANDIEFDETPAGAGDSLPDEDTACVVCVQTSIETTFDADSAEIMCLYCPTDAVVDFRASAASVAAVKLEGGAAWWWVNGQGFANPLTGDPIDEIIVSNGGTSAATLKIGVLYQSVA